MKKIQQALERKRAERSPLGSSSTMSVAAAPTVAAIDLGDLTLRKIAPDKKRLRENRVFLGMERESVAMAYKVLRTKVYQTLNKNGWKTLGITSSSQSEGKSLTSLNLALSLSGSVYQTVILIDFDMRRPSLARKMEYEPEFGLADYYTRDVPLTDILLQVEGTDMLLLPGKGSLEDASEWISSHKTERLMNELSQMFPSHYLIVDLPPVLAVDDVMAFGANMDCCLVVAAEGMTKKEELEESLRVLEFNNVLGVILNKSGEAQMGRYYYYNRYYKNYYR